MVLEIPDGLLVQVPLAYGAHGIFKVRSVYVHVELLRGRDLPDKESPIGASRVEQVGEMELRVRGACHAEDVVFVASEGQVGLDAGVVLLVEGLAKVLRFPELDGPVF